MAAAVRDVHDDLGADTGRQWGLVDWLTEEVFKAVFLAAKLLRCLRPEDILVGCVKRVRT